MEDQPPKSNMLRILFPCPDISCEGLVEEDVSDIELDANSNHAHPAALSRVLCADCGHVWDVIVSVNDEGKHVNVIDFPDTQVSFYDSSFDDDYAEFLADYEPKDPYDVYDRAVKENDNLLHGSTLVDGLWPAMHKLLYLNHVSAVEAFLSDKLIRLITSDNNKLLALIHGSSKFKGISAPLIDVAKDPNYAQNAVKRSLQRFSFHEFDHVAGFYKAVAKFDLFESKDHENELLKIAQIRHHIVHRNGRDNDGNPVVIEAGDLENIKEIFQRLVLRVEGGCDHGEPLYYLEPHLFPLSNE